MIAAAFLHPHTLHIAPSIVALLGAGVLILISGSAVSTIWPASSGTPYRRFVAGLCVMVGTLVKTGVMRRSAARPGTQRGGSALRGPNLIVLARGVVDDRVGVRVPTGAVLAPSLGAPRRRAREGEDHGQVLNHAVGE